MRIGIDFDNTIAGFDDVFVAAARAMGLVDAWYRGHKRALRDTIRGLPDGELAWQRLQGRVYGAGMASARLIDGVDAFLHRSRAAGEPVFIVSHKTEYGHHDPEAINLRQAALDWMTAHGFFRGDDNGYGLPLQNVFFEATRQKKLERIAALECTVFIDDLEEVLLDPAFPDGVTRVLFAESRNGIPPGVVHCRTWRQILEVVFDEPR
jgi:hypothetical protein